MATKPSKPVPAATKPTSKKSPKVDKTKSASESKKSAIKGNLKTQTTPVAPSKKKTVRKTISKASDNISLDPKPVSVEPIIPHDEIALRAYFIGERRHKMGWPGNSGTDWADAVSQLRSEALEKRLPKR